MDNENLKAQLLALQEEFDELKKRYDECSNALDASKIMVNRLKDSYIKLEQQHRRVINSRGWKLINVFYHIRNVLMPLGSRRWAIVKGILKPILKPFLWCGKKIAARKRKGFSSLSQEAAYEKLKSCNRIDVVAIKHTAFVAELLKGILEAAGIICNIHLSEPDSYEDIPYIMICPQNFKRFPSLYIAFQMEQTINPRWLTDSYIEILHNAYAVFDYSMVNIEYFSADPVLAPKLYYIPIDICAEKIAKVEENEKEYDVLFYGDPYIDRRREILDKIGEKFNLKILSDTFGEDLYTEMRRAKIIVNAHYYENALLETTRLYEALSKSDCLIVSEKSNDKAEDERLKNIVAFTEIGNTQELLSKIENWLKNEDERKQKVRENLKELRHRANAAKFYLYRFLLANDTVSFNDFYENCGNYINFDNTRICLSLPECIDRRKAFIADNEYGFTFFPALKHKMGWVGCGMSYKFILKKAKEQNLERILVCEDDVYFPPEFKEKLEKVLEYLEGNDDWNVFSGIMADVGRVKILKCEQQNGIDFVYLDKMISMVFNLYDKSVYDSIIEWDDQNRNVEANAIDRYLEDKNLRIVTTCPFLVGHKEDLNSTIWGQKNTIYTSLISDSSKKLSQMTETYKNRNS